MGFNCFCFLGLNHNMYGHPLARDQLLSEAKSKVRKQECRADFLDCAIRELEDKFIPVVWRLTIPIWHLEESGPDVTKNWRSEKEHFEKLILKVSTRWKN